MATPHSRDKIQRGMPNNKKASSRRLEPKVEGEGSYTASSDYAKSVDGFVKGNGAQIENLARQAAKDLDNDNSGELKKAAQIGKSHAKK